MSNARNAFMAALEAAKAAPMAKQASAAPREATEREKLASIKSRNEHYRETASRLKELGQRGFEKVSMVALPTNTLYSNGESSRSYLNKLAGATFQPFTMERKSTVKIAQDMGITSPDAALRVFCKTAATAGFDSVATWMRANDMELHIMEKKALWRQHSASELSRASGQPFSKIASDVNNDITAAKDAVQSIVKAKGELPSATDIAETANVSPLAANIAIHETAELIAAVGGSVAASDVPAVESGVPGPEALGAGMAPPMPPMDPAAAGMAPPMMPPPMPPMDPSMMGGPPMDPSMMGGPPPGPPMDPSMMGGPPMDPSMMGGPPPGPPMGGPPPKQASMTDAALARVIAKLAEGPDCFVERIENTQSPASDLSPIVPINPATTAGPTESSDSPSPAGVNPETSVGGESTRSSKMRDLDIFSGRAEYNPGIAGINANSEDVTGDLQINPSSLVKETVASILRKRAEEGMEAETEEDDDDEDDTKEVVSPAVDQESEIEDFIRKYVRENTELPEASSLESKFNISAEEAEGYISGFGDILDNSED